MEPHFVDLYCERTAAGFLNEPLNLFSNAIFFAAALMAAVKYKRSSPDAVMPTSFIVLAGLLFAVGIGSAAFHSTATTWANWLDRIFILIFVLAFFGGYLRDRLSFGAVKILLSLSGFTALTVFFMRFLDFPIFNHSNMYFGVVLFLIAVAIHSKHPALKNAAGLFIVALIFRTIDSRVCDVFPYGSHFLWHLTVGLSAYFCLASNIPQKAR